MSYARPSYPSCGSDGVYTRGLILDGARFNMEKMPRAPGQPKQLFTECPVMRMDPVDTTGSPALAVCTARRCTPRLFAMPWPRLPDGGESEPRCERQVFRLLRVVGRRHEGDAVRVGRRACPVEIRRRHREDGEGLEQELLLTRAV